MDVFTTCINSRVFSDKDDMSSGGINIVIYGDRSKPLSVKDKTKLLDYTNNLRVKSGKELSNDEKNKIFDIVINGDNAEVLSSSSVKVVTRSDFLSNYVGFTSEKTRNLLESTEEKILLIDEAYNLVTNEYDSFGKESVNSLGTFLVDNPHIQIIPSDVDLHTLN